MGLGVDGQHWASHKQMNSGGTALSQKAWLVPDVLREQPSIIHHPATVRISQRGFWPVLKQMKDHFGLVYGIWGVDFVSLVTGAAAGTLSLE